MWKVILKGLLAHRVRLVLTTLSVVLGVAFVAGTYVLTDTMTKVFDDLVRGGTSSLDVLVRGETGTDPQIGSEASYYGGVPFDESVLEVVREVEGVATAEGSVEGYAMIIRPDGEPIVPMGPPTLGGSWIEHGERLVMDGGQVPSRDGEVAIDRRTAERNGLVVGDQVGMVFASTPPRTFTVVGISTADLDNLAGASYAEFELSVAQAVLDREGTFSMVSVWAADGVPAEQLVERVQAALPEGTEAITAADWADETMAQIEEALGFFTIVLGVFAAIAVVVGAFIIANTFSITVLQRSREFALLRAFGAGRRQVVGAVLGEAVVVGLVASLLGVAAGMALARGLQALLSLFGMDMPSGSLVVEPRTVVIAVIVGVGVTVAAALLPARRAAAVHPLAALRDVAQTAYHAPRPRIVAGCVAAAAALTMVVYGAGALPPAAGTLVGAGAGLALVALLILGPILTRPLLRMFGGSGRHLGTVGRLARGNSMRTPRRTWSTAAALTVGLALVSGVAVLSASTKASIDLAVSGTLRADLVISSSNAFMGGSVPASIATQLRALPELDAVSPIRVSSGVVDGESTLVTSVDPSSWDRLFTTAFERGDLTALDEAGTVAVDRDLAAEGGYELGDAVPAEFATTGPTQLSIAAIYEPNEITSGWLTSVATSDAFAAEALDAMVMVRIAPDVATDEAVAAVESVTGAYPAVNVQDQTEYRESLSGQIDQLMAMITALLAMALFIALLGIMNTLALSVHERTREIGLLRAVGMTRRQARTMIRWEAVTVALLGAFVGIVLGTFLGWAATRALAAEGLTQFEVPVAQLVGAVVLAAAAGVLAAIWPARTAANLDVLDAVTVE